MAQRKVLIKYFPKNFDAQRLVKRGRGKDKLMIVRNMLPMSLRCNTCSNYLYIGTKFNMRMQICNVEAYLGIKVFRFYLKCTYCYADICFKTDPKNHDYVVETGGTRNYQAIRDAQQAEKLMKKLKNNEKQGNSMKYLQNKTYDSKRQMQLMQALDDIKTLNKRQAIIDPEDLLKTMLYKEDDEYKFTEEEEVNINQRYKELQERKQQQKTSRNKQSQQSKDKQISFQKKQQSPEKIDIHYKYQDKTIKKNKLARYKKKIIKTIKQTNHIIKEQNDYDQN